MIDPLKKQGITDKYLETLFSSYILIFNVLNIQIFIKTYHIKSLNSVAETFVSISQQTTCD